MIAIEISKPGAPEVLRPVERPMPEPAQGEVLIKVSAAGVNRPDLMQREGKYPPPPGASDIPGLEVAGTVVAKSHGVDRWNAGDQVCALLTGGGYAEYCVAPAAQCLPLPRRAGLAIPDASLSFISAAAIPETFFTVWMNVFDRGHLRAGETFLVHGGSSGIGTTAIQLAAAFGATVFTTAGSKEKCDACLSLGAARAVNYKEDDFVSVLMAQTGGRGVDVILDMVGGDYFSRNIDLLGLDGRLLQIALLNGSRAEISLAKLLRLRLTVTGSTLRSRSVKEKGAIASALEREVWPLLESGKVRPIVYAKFPLAQASEAHRMMEEGKHIGKVVLTVGEN